MTGTKKAEVGRASGKSSSGGSRKSPRILILSIDSVSYHVSFILTVAPSQEGRGHLPKSRANGTHLLK